MSRKPLRVEQLAKEADTDLDEVLVTLWDAGVEYVEGAASVVRSRDVAQARRALGLTDAREQGTVDYWLRVSGLTRSELRGRLAEVGVTLPERTRRIPKGSLRRLRSMFDERSQLASTAGSPLLTASKPIPEFRWETIGRPGPIEFLSEQQVLAVHRALEEDARFSGDSISPPGVKDEGLLSSAVHRPQTSLGSHRKYESVEMAAAALFHSIVLNHAFYNGNKRTGLVSLIAFLDAHKMVLPDPSLSGEKLAARIEAWSVAVTTRCVELDPSDATAPKRSSDGRSMWHEPISPHITTEAILAEEELIASWALAAQADEPCPSTTVHIKHLDVLQADVAAAVAGDDLLVLVVGTAGAGKTTTLRAAVDDLDRAARRVFGVAPSAKAARVLERETGVASDTLAKLLHEWQRADRSPLDRYRLPAGSTVIVDEAGMVGTASLATLTRLATEHDWRLALVGDPRQLQAVGRGGMFQELCATGRAHELARVHRFREDWEAAASLQLRRGDPRALDAYFAHDRVLAEHTAFLAAHWRSLRADGQTCAINMSSNDHVDAVNATIQAARVAAGDLDTTRAVRIGGGERAHVGDLLVTRRNERRLTTTAGEPVRNRETWTVVGVGEDGWITMSSNLGAGSVTLPAEYARHHVRLGYAATEHGIQGDTTTAGAELVSEATSRRGLYVGVTRGREENLILVITETYDLDQARDVLERVLANDRADLPAVA